MRLDRTQCRDLADKWLMLSRRSEGWLRLVQGMAEINGRKYTPGSDPNTQPSAAVIQRELVSTLIAAPNYHINRLNLIVITRRLTGE